MDVDFDVEKQVVFDEAWGVLNRRFNDPNFNGQDWGKLRERFQPQIDGARNGDELRRIINLMIGELNASHSGIAKPGDPERLRRFMSAIWACASIARPFEAGRAWWCAR